MSEINETIELKSDDLELLDSLSLLNAEYYSETYKFLEKNKYILYDIDFNKELSKSEIIESIYQRLENKTVYYLERLKKKDKIRLIVEAIKDLKEKEVTKTKIIKNNKEIEIIDNYIKINLNEKLQEIHKQKEFKLEINKVIKKRIEKMGIKRIELIKDELAVDYKNKWQLNIIYNFE